MKKWTGILLALVCSGFAHGAAHDGVLFEIVSSKQVPAEQVGDSVFWYKASEIECKSDDEETPCLAHASVDHWENVCYEASRKEDVCAAMQNLFDISREQLMNGGAEEDVELLGCNSEGKDPILHYYLWSFHGGPNVEVQNKLIPDCASLIK